MQNKDCFHVKSEIGNFSIVFIYIVHAQIVRRWIEKLRLCNLTIIGCGYTFAFFSINFALEMHCFLNINDSHIFCLFNDFKG